MAIQDWEHVTQAARVVADLVDTEEVVARWNDESSCEGMTVGGLARHTAGQIDNVARLLSQEPSGEEPIALLEHYRRAAWSNTALDEEVNVSIRDTSNAEAAVGHASVVSQIGDWSVALAAALSGEVPPTTLIPWQGWVLSTDDFLATRFMEMVVHADDLAVSVGLPTPEFPDQVVSETMRLLTAVAVDRHGQAAVVRALSRPQRAPASVSAF